MRDFALIRPARRPIAAAAVLAVLALAGFFAIRSITPPAARPASAPAGDFSAERAFEHVRQIAAAPHPAGSPANEKVHDHLIDTLRGLGLSPESQDTVTIQGGTLSASAGGAGLARVRNVVTLIPGAASTGRIILVAHYDSAQVGPGGNDDAAGTATILETARALTSAGGRLRNDVVLLLTDAEEACLCGAKAFVDQHPLAKDGGVVLNLEARGSDGPAIMFETSDGNGRLVSAYGAAPQPVGTSFAVEIYRLLPNDTDFTPFLDAGFLGMNAAYIDGAAVYHAPTDTPESMNTASLQHHGENTLAVVRELGGRDLSGIGEGGDATYFPVPGLLVRYPGSLVWPLAALALVAVAALAWLVRRQGRATGKRMVAAGTLTLIPIVVAPALAQGLWALLTVIRPEYGGLPIDPYRPLWYRLAVIALAAFTILTWYVLLRRKVGPAALAVAGFGWLAVLGAVLAAVTPGGAYLATLPALAGAFAALIALTAGEVAGVVAIAAGGVVAVVILLPTVLMLFPALGMPMAGVGAFLTVLLGLALLPVADLIHPASSGARGMAAWRDRRLGAVPSAVALVAVLAGTGTGLAVDRFDDEHPSLTHLMYALDADTQQARWLSHETDPQDWTAQYLTEPPGTVTGLLPAFGDEELRQGPAPAWSDLAAPQLTMIGDSAASGERTLRLLLKPQRPARFVTLHAGSDTVVTRATVAGRPVEVTGSAGDGWGFGFVFHAPPAEGVEVTLTVRGAGPVKFRAMDATDDVTTIPGFRPRPSGVGVLGSHSSEMVAVAKSYTF
ncbi:putative M28-family peptidase [Actinoplanes missouriensis 431]|uniref:Vacuolar membrane protease n=1 Tax=Actinoplanes missouriensis (strain ATCC 14538 / DSM 43046 / CBS 188.64 / JCM 3121 / NBRC 102363 / NCIMB 12654 / NRRL B-3342 / UNCC 431) TaxID=512565 RepID=I0GY99_ACTM4|nr:M20/M25/M40 family metallo-hydrolase [Actinoplanes missouriensis]BAL85736.1 putative M28-family peptidase [Actinoplanes missouriensis 431]